MPHAERSGPQDCAAQRLNRDMLFSEMVVRAEHTSSGLLEQIQTSVCCAGLPFVYATPAIIVANQGHVETARDSSRKTAQMALMCYCTVQYTTKTSH